MEVITEEASASFRALAKLANGDIGLVREALRRYRRDADNVEGIVTYILERRHKPPQPTP